MNTMQNKDWSQRVTMRNITSEEYGILCHVTNENDGLMHWNEMFSITDTLFDGNTSYRVIRGYGSARHSIGDYAVDYGSLSGFRPAFKSLTPDPDCADLRIGDVVVMGTLYVGDDAIKVPTNPVYNGDVTAYGVDGFSVVSKITLGAALDNPAYQVKAVYVGSGLFICDRVMLNHISWNQIHAAISPNKPTKDWSQLVAMRTLTSELYDGLGVVTKWDDGLMHWRNMFSWTDDASGRVLSYKLIRGYFAAMALDDAVAHDTFEYIGLRPVFEIVDADFCTSLKVGDVVVMGTLYVGDRPVKVPQHPTYDGDITSYGQNNTSKITLGLALEDEGYQMKAVYIGDGLFVCDRVMLNWISADAVDDHLIQE